MRERSQGIGGHVPALDGVRGLAIAMVLALHFIGDTEPVTRLDRVMVRVCEFGAFGVDLFFVLSGFLITGILIDARDKPRYYRNFYARRAVRIFPLYYVVLVGVFVATSFMQSSDAGELASVQIWAWFYGVNVLTAIRGTFAMPYLDHFWSLAVEEHFYFVWPFVVARARGSLVRVALLVAAASFLSRVVLATHVSPIALYVLTPFRLDALVLGGAMAAIARAPGGLDRLGNLAPKVAACAVAFIVVSFVYSQRSRFLFERLHECRNGAFVALCACIIPIGLTVPLATRALVFRPLRELGKYSYGLYVFHHFASFYLVRHHTERWLGQALGSHTLAVLVQASAGIALSTLVAVTSFHVFEKRFLSLKRRWEARSPA